MASMKVNKSSNEVYEIKLAETRNLPDVLRIMRENFYHDETMFKSLCLSSNINENEKKQIDGYFDGTIMAAFESSPCLIAVHERTMQVVGVNITAFSENPKNGKKIDGLATIFSSDVTIPPLAKKYIEYLSKMNEEFNIFERFPEARTVWEFYAIAIDKRHRKLGLASDLMKVGIELAKKAEVSLIFGVFTSIYSKKSAEKVGMKSIMEFDLAKYTDQDGNPVFTDSQPHSIVSVMILDI